MIASVPEYPSCVNIVASVLISTPSPVPDALEIVVDMSEPSC